MSRSALCYKPSIHYYFMERESVLDWESQCTPWSQHSCMQITSHSLSWHHTSSDQVSHCNVNWYCMLAWIDSPHWSHKGYQQSWLCHWTWIDSWSMCTWSISIGCQSRHQDCILWSNTPVHYSPMMTLDLMSSQITEYASKWIKLWLLENSDWLVLTAWNNQLLIDGRWIDLEEWDMGTLVNHKLFHSSNLFSETKQTTLISIHPFIYHPNHGYITYSYSGCHFHQVCHCKHWCHVSVSWSCW